MIDRIARWADTKPDIRLVLLTSSRARTGAPVDALSDWDVILYASDPAALLSDRSWPGELGPVLVQMPPKGQEQSWTYPTRLVLYDDGTKIDFTILPVSAAARPSEELKAGYRVLLDKDNLAAALPAASGAAYVLRPPTQEELSAVIEEFWWETTYVAKNLRRDELLPAKYSFECVIKLDLVRRMLEWRVALDHDWNYSPGVMGRGLRRRLDQARWRELEEAFAGDDWRALWRTIALFRSAATDVAQKLALRYPEELDAKMTRYLELIATASTG